MQIALVVLLALLVGALLPLLLSAFSLIKQAKKTLIVLEERSVALTESTEQVLKRVDSIAVSVEAELPSLQRTSQRIDELGGSIETLTETVHKVQAMGNILGPAVAAGLNAYRIVKQGQDGEPVDQEALPDAVHEAILADLKAKIDANGDLPPPEPEEPAS